MRRKRRSREAPWYVVVPTQEDLKLRKKRENSWFRAFMFHVDTPFANNETQSNCGCKTTGSLS